MKKILPLETFNKRTVSLNFPGHPAPGIKNISRQTSFFIFLLICIQSYDSFSQLGEWTWMNGSAGNASTAVYGTQGVAAAANTPQGFYEPCEWQDKDGNFWLYGGYAPSGTYSNLWKYDPATNMWTWVKGPGNTSNEYPVYGTQGVSAPGNTPGGRAWGISTWVDTSGNFWLLGGRDYSGNAMNDLWEYNIGTNEWTWMKGPSTSSSSGVYGTQGVTATGNYPGGRSETSATWTDPNNNLWLFGGYGYDSNGGYGVLNDVWKYDVPTNNWTWMRGSKFNGNSGSYGIKGVADTTNNPPSRMVFTKWTDPYGDFWIFGGGNFITNIYYNDVWKYDPLINKWTWMSGSNLTNGNGNAGSFCESDTDFVGPARFENRACWMDSCGNFWTFGGSVTSGVDNNYNDLWHFNSQTLEWTYVKGSLNLNNAGSFGTQGVSSPTNRPSGRAGSLSWVDSVGNLWLWGGTTWPDCYNDVWRYVIDPTCPAANLCVFFPVANFSGVPTAFCDSGCVNFTNLSLFGPTSWQWQFPGANPDTSSAENPASICYNTPGSYDVTLIVSNVNGTDTITIPNFINVYPSPVPPSITQSQDTLTSSPAGNYQWYFNSVIIPGATDQQVVITQSGTYSVVVTDSNGCTATASYDTNFPSSAFAASDTSLCEKFCLDFFDQSVNNPTSWEWLFDGGVPSSSTLQNPTQICYQTPGVYDVTLITTNTYGSDTLTLIDYIIVNATPPFPVISQSGNTLTSTPAVTYQWQFNSVDIPGATNQSYDAQQTGYYSVIITDQNGCVSATTVYVVLEGIEDLAGNEDVSIYPNPSNGNFILTMSGAGSGEVMEINVYNTLGQIVFAAKEKLTGSLFKKEITLGHVAAAVYTVELKSRNISTMKKVVVTR